MLRPFADAPAEGERAEVMPDLDNPRPLKYEDVPNALDDEKYKRARAPRSEPPTRSSATVLDEMVGQDNLDNAREVANVIRGIQQARAQNRPEDDIAPLRRQADQLQRVWAIARARQNYIQMKKANLLEGGGVAPKDQPPRPDELGKAAPRPSASADLPRRGGDERGQVQGGAAPVAAGGTARVEVPGIQLQPTGEQHPTAGTVPQDESADYQQVRPEPSARSSPRYRTQTQLRPMSRVRSRSCVGEGDGACPGSPTPGRTLPLRRPVRVRAPEQHWPVPDRATPTAAWATPRTANAPAAREAAGNLSGLLERLMPRHSANLRWG